MKVVVTGGAGFIGSHLTERLAGNGHELVVIDNLNDYYSPELKGRNAKSIQAAGARLYQLDLAEDDLTEAVAGAEVVYHLAAQPGLSSAISYDNYERNNIRATKRLLDAVRKDAGGSLQAFINIATSSIYGLDATRDETTVPEPSSYYGVTKLAAEQLVMAYQRNGGFPACSMRLFSVYGPRERPEKLYPLFIRSILKGEAFPLYEGSEEHVRSFTYVDDIVEGLVLGMEKFDSACGEIFNIGTDQCITTGEGMKIVEEIMGETARIEVKPKRSGDQLKTHANIEKARNVLGYEPKINPREGLEETVRWVKEDMSAASAT